MAVSKKILGMNARNFLYIREHNHRSAIRIADDKLETKQILLKNDIATPDLIAVLPDRNAIRKFNWSVLPERGFVIKPARGYGGSGILPIKKWGITGISSSDKEYNIKQLESHLFDIVEGAYSLQYLPDQAFIEERIVLDPFFRKLAPIGIPDVRVIVFQSIPVMAMIRIPTQESGGKANLHLGAVAIGIDIRTGITTHAIHHNEQITILPDTKLKVRGIKIPKWNELLLLATRALNTSGLGYGGVDIVFDAKKGMMVLEVNARPGLAIQNANLKSLRTRLERIEDVKVQSAARGVEVAQSLFYESFSEKVQIGPKILMTIEKVQVMTKKKIELELEAKIDTGAYRTSIDKNLAEALGLEAVPGKVYVKSASGENTRDVVKMTFVLGGRKISSIASVTDRSGMKYPMIVGRRDLQGFYINPHITEAEISQEEHDNTISYVPPVVSSTS